MARPPIDLSMLAVQVSDDRFGKHIMIEEQDLGVRLTLDLAHLPDELHDRQARLTSHITVELPGLIASILEQVAREGAE